MIHVHNKSQMYIVHNHRPLSLLPVASKIFQAIYNNLLNYIEHENINQSGFHAKGSCINQLITITHEILYVQLQPIHEVKGYFWIYLMYLAIFGTRDFCSKLMLLLNLLNLLEDYLFSKFQRVLYNV